MKQITISNILTILIFRLFEKVWMTFVKYMVE
jgi:hypothetical protein